VKKIRRKNLEETNLNLSKKKIKGRNGKNIACRIQIGVRFYPRRFPRMHVNLNPERITRSSTEEKTSREKEVEENRNGRKVQSRQRDVRGTVPSFSLCISPAAFSALDSSHCNSRLLLSPRVEGDVGKELRL